MSEMSALAYCDIRLDDEPLLSAVQQQELAAAAAAGDSEAERRIVRANLRLVAKIAQRYAGRGLEAGDLVGEGVIGLIRAAKEFKATAGVKFATYAAHWIRHAIRRAVSDSSSLVSLSEHARSLLSAAEAAERRLTKELEREPTLEEIASELGLSRTQQRTLCGARLSQAVSTEAGVSRPAIDPVDPHPAGADAIGSSYEAGALLDCVHALEAEERAVILLRYGIAPSPGARSQRETGALLGRSREWIAQLEARAIAKLRAAMIAREGSAS
jgi:RNA polymerase primary sigma factor